MVYSGLFPTDGDDFERLRDALEKLRLNDTALVYEPETSCPRVRFRCGFLGLLHMEIVRAAGAGVRPRPGSHRPVRGLPGDHHRWRNPRDPVAAGPARAQQAALTRGAVRPGNDHRTCGVHRGHHGAVAPRRARPPPLSEPGAGGARLPLPLADVVFDFFDAVKSRTRGYASLDYEPSDYRPSDLVRGHSPQRAAGRRLLDHHPQGQGAGYGRRMVERLRELIPRQLFDVPVQAASGGRIIARETIKARRKDVTAKCYGGDITRKRKPLERQKEGRSG